MSTRTVRRIALVLGLVWPWVLPLPLAVVNDATRAALYAMVAVSLVLLTGWVGQISLAQGAFVGIGAFTTALASRRLAIGFPFSLPIAMASAAAVAAALGVVALRVRGLYLAVATLIFAWMADAWLFSSTWLVGSSGSASVRLGLIGRTGTIPSFDLHDVRVLYLIVLAGLAFSVYGAANLRDSKTGRAFFAIRGSEMGAASMGIDVTRYKLLAFGLSGALAGLAGHLQIVWQGSDVPADFNFLKSLFFLSVAVVGGMASLPGVVAAGVVFSVLGEIFFRVPALNGYIDLVSGLLLLTVLLAYPGGLASGARSLAVRVAAARTSLDLRRPRWARWTAAPVVDDPESSTSASPGPDTPGGNGLAVPTGLGRVRARARVHHALAAEEPAVDRAARRPVLHADGITVRFGGIVAVDSVSIRVHEGEIVGLIGPNGAGKTTLFNAIAGLNDPAGGTVSLFGRDATKLPVHARAALGVGRTFQLLQLFPHLDVFGNVLVGTHASNRTGFVQHLAVTEAAIAAERSARERAQWTIETLGLGDVSNRRISELPFGVLRLVELARALATGAPFVMLDEPASGLDNTETARLAQTLRTVRAELGVTILLIEHDVPMVMSVSDYIYVIDRGRPLAEGSPVEIQRNEDVVAAYLGRPERMEASA